MHPPASLHPLRLRADFRMSIGVRITQPKSLMNLRTYTLSVSLAAIVGLLLSVMPLVRSVLEYRSPSSVLKAPAELSSLEVFVVGKSRNPGEVNYMLRDREGWYESFGKQWQALYDEAKAHHTEAVRKQTQAIRQKAMGNLVAYGILCGVCVLLMITHLLWMRRSLREAILPCGQDA